MQRSSSLIVPLIQHNVADFSLKSHSSHPELWDGKYEMYRKSRPISVRYGWLLLNSLGLWEVTFQALIQNLLSINAKSKAREDCNFPEPARSDIIPEAPP